MSRVNSVRTMEENASESGSDGVDVYVDPVRGQEDNNEEQVKGGENDENENDNIKQRYNGGDAGDHVEQRADRVAREARHELEKYLALQHLRQQERDTLAMERDVKQAALEALALERATRQEERLEQQEGRMMNLIEQVMKGLAVVNSRVNESSTRSVEGKEGGAGYVNSGASKEEGLAPTSLRPRMARLPVFEMDGSVLPHDHWNEVTHYVGALPMKDRFIYLRDSLGVNERKWLFRFLSTNGYVLNSCDMEAWEHAYTSFMENMAGSESVRFTKFSKIQQGRSETVSTYLDRVESVAAQAGVDRAKLIISHALNGMSRHFSEKILLLSNCTTFESFRKQALEALSNLPKAPRPATGAETEEPARRTAAGRIAQVDEGNTRTEQSGLDGYGCSGCGETDHRWRQCPNTQCFGCNGYGHIRGDPACTQGMRNQAGGRGTPGGRGRGTFNGRNNMLRGRLPANRDCLFCGPNTHQTNECEAAKRACEEGRRDQQATTVNQVELLEDEEDDQDFP